MSAKHQGVGAGGGYALSCVKLKVVYGLKMSKTSDLDSFHISKENILHVYVYCVYEWWALSRGGGECPLHRTLSRILVEFLCAVEVINWPNFNSYQTLYSTIIKGT